MVREDSLTKLANLKNTQSNLLIKENLRKKSLDDNLDKSKDTSTTSTGGDQSYKTELCRTWVEKNFCPYREKCRFAHGKRDLHDKNVASKNYKQKECNSFYKKGFCPYGPRCHFKHEERKLDDISRPYYPFLLNSENTVNKFNQMGESENNNNLLKNSQSLKINFNSMQGSLPVFSHLRTLQSIDFFPKYERDFRKYLDSCM